jgi:four helix bundle protein
MIAASSEYLEGADSCLALLMTYRDLIAWQRAMRLAEEVYALCRELPVEERFGLSAQMRRSVRSVAANIAEGYGRRRTGEYRRFLAFANGSLLELETDLELAARTGLLPQLRVAPLIQLSSEVGRILAGLRRRLRSSRASGGPDA